MQDLRAEAADLRKQVVDLQSLNRQFPKQAQLQKLIEARQLERNAPVAANVIGTSLTAWATTITIDRGSTDGIEVDHAVVGASGEGAGLVGFVSHVTARNATVALLPSQGLAIGARLEGKDPIRVVLGTAPAGARVLPALEFSGELTDLLDSLGQRGVLQVLVEGGATVAGAFHRAGLVDHYVIYLAPVLFGGDDARPLFAGAGAETIADVWRGAITNVTPLGGDVRIDLAPVGPSAVTGPVPVVRLGSVPLVSNPAPGGA